MATTNQVNKQTQQAKKRTPAAKKTTTKEKSANERLSSVMEDIRMTDEGKVELNGRKYTTVAKRNEVFRKEFGFDVKTLTEILHMEGDVVVLKATISFRNNATGEWEEVATGHAEENRGQSQMNSVSALENAETSAIGRALSNLGLSGGEFSSFDETSQKMSQSQKPQQTKKMSNNYQLKEINKLIDGDESIRNKYFKKYNVDSIEKLTYSEAANVIKDLKQSDNNNENSNSEEEPNIL